MLSTGVGNAAGFRALSPAASTVSGMSAVGIIRRVFAPVRNRWLQHPLVDVGIAVVLASGVWFVAKWRVPGADLLGQMAFADRMSLYTDLITVTGIFVGFSATGLAAYLALSGKNIERLRDVAHGQILKQWLSALGGSSVALLVFLICKVLDRKSGVDHIHWVAMGAFVFLVTRAIRMFYVFAQLSGIATQPPFERNRTDRQNHLRNTG